MSGEKERGKKIPSGTVGSNQISQQQQQGPSWQCRNLAKSWNDESNDEEDDGTACKTCKITWIELTEKC